MKLGIRSRLEDMSKDTSNKMRDLGLACEWSHGDIRRSFQSCVMGFRNSLSLVSEFNHLLCCQCKTHIAKPCCILNWERVSDQGVLSSEQGIPVTKIDKSVDDVSKRVRLLTRKALRIVILLSRGKHAHLSKLIIAHHTLLSSSALILIDSLSGRSDFLLWRPRERAALAQAAIDMEAAG